MFTNENSLFRCCRYTGDIREEPAFLCGYAISCEPDRGSCQGRVAVGADYIAHRQAKTLLFAKSKSVAELGNDIKSLLEVHTPEMHKQVESVLNAVNEVRKDAGLELVTPGQAGLGEAVVLTLNPRRIAQACRAGAEEKEK